MKVYHTRLLSGGGIGPFSICAMAITLFVYLFIALAFLGSDNSALATIIIISFFSLLALFLLVILAKFSRRALDITFGQDSVHLLMPAKFLRRQRERDIFFNDITLLKALSNKGYIDVLTIKLNSGTKYIIDPSQSMFRNIDDYSTLNFGGDLIAGYTAYVTTNNLPSRYINIDRTAIVSWTYRMPLIDGLLRMVSYW